MPRGGHRHGYNWGVADKDKTNVKVPKEIASEVQQLAQELWEEKKKESNKTAECVKKNSLIKT